jgi:hypothetical protein
MLFGKLFIERYSMSGNEIVKMVRNAEIGLTGKRFCGSCQSMQSATLGAMTEGKKVNWWQCVTCSNRKSRRMYQKKGEGDA